MKGYVYLLILLGFGFRAYGQVPSYGYSYRCDVATWNLYWYGDAQNGPINKQFQSDAVGEVVRNSGVDIWFFQEVVDTASLSAVLAANGNYGHVYSRYWQSQKTGLAWKTTDWEYISDSTILDVYYSDFANGRLPLYCSLKSRKTGDTLHLINIHLKAHTGDNQQKQKAWKNRINAVNHLKEWVGNYPDRKIIIAGDWNDDVDKSIYADSLSPLLPLKGAGAFLDEALSYNGGHSWYYGQDMIDHIWVNSRFFSDYVNQSSRLLPLDIYFSNYPKSVSDHFPVFAAFNYPVSRVEKPECPSFMMYPNPSSGSVNIQSDFEISRIEVFDLQGKKMIRASLKTAPGQWSFSLEPGTYLLRIYGGEVPLCRRLVLRP